jgi:hypothetical protein
MGNIFDENGFKISRPTFLTKETGFLASNLDEYKTTYFVVIFVEFPVDIDVFAERQVELFNHIKRLKEEYDRQMDKNMTLILCLKRENLLPDEKVNKLIFELEEDPFHFKKHVLNYTDKQVEKFKNELDSIRTTDHMYKTVNNKQKFTQYKSNISDESSYNLVARLFIKLPFMKYIGAEKELENLSEEINRDLSESDLLEVRDHTIDMLKALSAISDEGKKLEYIISTLGGVNNG